MAYDIDGSQTDTKRVVDRANINDALLAGTPDTTKRVLVLAPLQTTGSKVDGDLVELITSADDAGTYFGPIARDAFDKFFAINPLARVDAIAVAEGAGTAAAGSIKFNAAAAADDTLTISMGGYDVDFDVTEDDTDEELATALAAAVTADANAPFSAVVNGVTAAQVDFTYDFKGTLGNSEKLHLWDNGAIDTAPTYVQPTGGATDPSHEDYTDTFKDGAYRIIVNPWTGTAADMEHLEDTVDYMTAAEKAQGAMLIQYLKTSLATAATWAAARQNWAFMAGFMNSDECWLEGCFTAAMVEAAYHSAQSDPSVPFHKQTRRFLRQYPGGAASTTTVIENALLAGLSPLEMDDNGDARIHAAVTTATKLSTGVTSYAKSSVHIFYTAIELRRAILADLATSNATPAQRKMVDGKAGDIKATIVLTLEKYASPTFAWLSKAKLDLVKSDIVIARSSTNLQRVAGGAALPIIQDYRGTDLTLWLVA